MTDKQMIDGTRCNNCKFYHFSNSIGSHQCRKSPPVLIPDVDKLHAYWPDIKPNDWCGEFQSSPLNENEEGESE